MSEIIAATGFETPLCGDKGCPRDELPEVDRESWTYEEALAEAHLDGLRNGAFHGEHLFEEARQRNLTSEQILASRGCAALKHTIELENIQGTPDEVIEPTAIEYKALNKLAAKFIGFI